MSTRRLRPAVVSGRVRAPPSKSYTHRAVVAGFLSGRVHRIANPLDSDDTRATLRLVAALGAEVHRRPGRWTICPRDRAGRSGRTVDCGESGTTLRFGVALASLDSAATCFTGRGRLPLRPVGPLLRALRMLGGTAVPSSTARSLPLRVTGPIHGGRVSVDASESSQFASALLLALPTLTDRSRIVLRGRVVSAPYLDATRAVLRAHRVRVRVRSNGFEVPGAQAFAARQFVVPGDASSAAYLWAGAAVTGGAVQVDDLDGTWPQADLRILDLLRQTGCDVRVRRSSVRVAGRSQLGFSMNFTASPDLYPLAGAIAATIPRTSRLSGAPHLASKESDRRTETVRLVRALGASVRETSGGLTIHGVSRPQRVRLPDLADHRLTMSAAVAALAADGPSTIGPADSVAKSFPGFWEALGSLGAEVAAR